MVQNIPNSQSINDNHLKVKSHVIKGGSFDNNLVGGSFIVVLLQVEDGEMGLLGSFKFGIGIGGAVVVLEFIIWLA